MKEAEIKKFKKRLEGLRAEILKVIHWNEKNTESSEALDEIDQANELIEREMGFLMSTNMRANLKEVEEAIDRIQKNEFGKCIQCCNDIPLKRLELLPFAKYCVPCQQLQEERNR